MEPSFELPSAYNKDTLILMVRDPQCAFAYWEVTEETTGKHPSLWQGTGLTLRVLEIVSLNGTRREQIYKDVSVEFRIGSWYLHLNAPSRHFVAEIGFFDLQGNFVPLVRSNEIAFPPENISDLTDSEWMQIDDEFTKIFKASFPAGHGPNSEEMHELSKQIRHLVQIRRVEQSSGSLPIDWRELSPP